MVKESARIGTETVLSGQVHQQDRISKSEAYRRFGRSCVDRWLQEGLLKQKPNPVGKSNKGIDRIKLEAIAATSNRATYLPLAER